GRVEVKQAPFGTQYGNQGTGGSSSVRTSYQTMRQAGAALRGMLVSAAAAQWGVPVAECTTEPSLVIHRPSGRKLTYGALAARAAALPVPEAIPLKSTAEFRLVGRPRKSVITPDVVHGRIRYGLDQRVPGMLFAAIERAPVFGARVKGFDPARARAVQGVVDVVEVPPVASGANVHAGVAVVAETTWAALAGRKALTVEWDPGPGAGESSAGHTAAMRAALDGPGRETVNRQGDPDGVLARAAGMITADYEVPFIAHATMEPMNCTVHVQDDRVEIWSPTQTPASSVQGTARALGIPVENVTLHVTMLGGGFGRRLNSDYTVEAALVGRQIQRPVQVMWTREDDLRHDFYRPCAVHRLHASLGSDGYPEAWRQRFSTPAISATVSGTNQPGYGVSESDGGGNMGYRVPNRSCEYTLLESGIHRGWWRAVHTTHNTFAVECFLDELAAAAGRDPYEYRMALIDEVTVDRPAQSRDFPFRPERLKGVLRLAAEKAGWGRALPPGRAMGIACGFDHLSYAAIVVEVSTRGDAIRIERIVCAGDCGPVVNPNGATAQLQGGLIQALSVALHERITIAGGGVQQSNFDDYPILRIDGVPAAVEVVLANSDY
ncbi:MAG TPA: molybdopterin cofactor-binding domain-containing protein, partial [Gemmatimonadales bacterium]|nr:molybdopterin cofactor-binding domain-containing protein [Gemmatimonadales bacterium]